MKSKLLPAKKIQLSPLISILIETTMIFSLILLPLSVNIASKPPSFSIVNTSDSGLSIFSTLLQNKGYQTRRLLVSLKPLIDIENNSALVIAGGTKVYSKAELLLITQYVVRGGTLLILGGDDTAERVANAFGIYFGFPILETVNYYKTPDIIITRSPITENGSLCFIHPLEMVVMESNISREIGAFSSSDTAFVDVNADGKWNVKYEKTRSLKLITMVQYGEGYVLALSTPSFLCNDMYIHGFDNLNLVLYYIGLFVSGSNPVIYFEESHKTWPIVTIEGILNDGYGTIVRLSNNISFLVLLVIAILVFYYFLPRYRMILFPKEDFKQILSKRIWSREKELYDTYGVVINPTIEEKTLTNLFFLYETEGEVFYNIILKQKLSYIPKNAIKDEEYKLFEKALERRLDHDTFMLLFNKLEELQKRSKR